MDAGEFEKLWTLLKEVYKNAAAIKSENTKTIWQYALQPYRMEDVREAIMDHIRTSKFFPDIADLTSGLAVEEQPKRNSDIAWMKPYIEEHDRQLLAKWGTWEAYREHLRSIGVPDPVSGLE